VEAQINASAFDAAMAEEITYGLEWRALSEKMHGQSVAKNVRTAKARGTHTGAHRPEIEHVKDCSRLDRTPRGTDAQEKTPLAGLPRTLA
jgi:hypothetical protein